jgi:hypothetical protein
MIEIKRGIRLLFVEQRREYQAERNKKDAALASRSPRRKTCAGKAYIPVRVKAWYVSVDSLIISCRKLPYDCRNCTRSGKRSCCKFAKANIRQTT